jgi:hypothetical protein
LIVAVRKGNRKTPSSHSGLLKQELQDMLARKGKKKEEGIKHDF